MPEAITLTLPVPPSGNRYWRHARGRTYRSAEANAYRDSVAVLALAQRVRAFSGPLALSVDWYRAAKRGDLDNRIKVLSDALQGLLYDDDNQIVELHAYRHEDKDNPRVVVTARIKEPVA